VESQQQSTTIEEFEVPFPRIDYSSNKNKEDSEVNMIERFEEFLNWLSCILERAVGGTYKL